MGSERRQDCVIETVIDFDCINKPFLDSELPLSTFQKTKSAVVYRLKLLQPKLGTREFDNTLV